MVNIKTSHGLSRLVAQLKPRLAIPNVSSLWLLAWFAITLFLLPNQLGRIILGTSPRAIFLVLTVIIGLLILFRVVKIHKLRIDLFVFCLLGGLLFQSLGLITAFISYLNNPSSAHTINNQVTIIICFAIAVILMTSNNVRRNINFYALFQCTLAVAALVVFVRVMLFQASTESVFVADNEGAFANYTLAIEKLTARVGGVQRIQSFYEEPGTFAMFILPAFYWLGIGKRAKLSAALLAIALVATLSFGAFVTVILVSLYLAFCYRHRRSIQIGVISSVIFVGSIVFCVALYTTANPQSDTSQWISQYLRGKVNSGDEYSSGAQRVEEINKLSTLLQNKPLGVEFEALTEADAIAQQEAITNISVGIFVSIARAGLVGLIGYGLIIFGILGMLWRVAVIPRLTKNRELVGYSAGILALVVMSFQRGDMFNFYSLMILLAGFVKFYGDLLFTRQALIPTPSVT